MPLAPEWSAYARYIAEGRPVSYQFRDPDGDTVAEFALGWPDRAGDDFVEWEVFWEPSRECVVAMGVLDFTEERVRLVRELNGWARLVEGDTIIVKHRFGPRGERACIEEY